MLSRRQLILGRAEWTSTECPPDAARSRGLAKMIVSGQTPQARQ